MKSIYVFLTSGLLIYGCGAKKDDPTVSAETPSKSTTTDSSKSTTTTGNALSIAFPGTLALSVFSQELKTGLSLADATVYDPSSQSLETKVAESTSLLSGDAKSCLPTALASSFTKDEDETCYQFDQDMIYGTGDNTQASPKYSGTKNGKSSTGEACLVSFTRNQVSQAIALVDQTLGFGMSALCQAKKIDSSVDLPAVGKSLDLKAALEALFGDKMTVTSATLERLDDYTDADKVVRKLFRILIVTKVTADGLSRTVGIIHSPKDDKNAEYSGTIYTEMDGDIGSAAPKDGPAPKQNSDKHRFMSIVYAKVAEKDGTSKIKAELRTAQVAKALAVDAIGSDGVLNLNVGADLTPALTSQDYGKYTGYSQANDAVDGITFIAFDINTSTSEGTLAYWKNPGGNYFENARGFNIAIERDTDDNLAGCATSGAASTNFSSGISIRRYLNSAESANSLTLEPKGDWHPFFNTPTTTTTEDIDGVTYTKFLRNQNSGQVSQWYQPLLSDATIAGNFSSKSDGPYITRQCFTQDKTSGLYLIDTSKITESAGFEVLDTGNTVNKDKFISPPQIDEAKPIDQDVKQ